MNSQEFAKLIFLTFVVVIAGYIMYTNNNPTIERFEATKAVQPTKKTPTTKPSPQPTTTSLKSTEQRVREVYKDLFGGDAKEEEVNFYVRFFKDREVDDNYMRDIISSSAPTLQKTLKTGTQPLIPNTPQGTEDEVIAIFNDILERHPDAEELQYYASFIKDNNANIEKMKVLLLQSSEYKRLQQLQDNKANGFLLGGITDKQLMLMVNDVYSQVGGNPDKLDEDTFKFLKKKYLEFQLNQPVFKKFLQDFVLYDSKAKSAPQQKTSSTNTKSANDSSLHANASVTNKLVETSIPSKTNTTQETYMNSKVDTQAMIDKIKQEADCQFNKDKLDNQHRSNREVSLASAVHDRNRAELKNICERNKSFAKYHDEDMVLIPGQQWSVPQIHTPSCYGNKLAYNPMIDQTSLIGTLLTDAKDTEIGSIMPKFTYKEHHE